MRCHSNAPSIDLTHLHTDREGLGIVLGPLELTLMQTLWESDRPRLTNKELRLQMSQAGVDITVGTVGTTMRRLARKGFVREEQENFLLTYTATLDEEGLERYVVEYLLALLAGMWPQHLAELGALV